MKVVLRQDVEHVGQAGEVKEVTAGHARNYLFPRRLAEVASVGVVKRVEEIRKAAIRRAEKALAEARALSEKVAAIPVTIPVRTGGGDRVFGSVTRVDIAQALARQGTPVDRRAIDLERPIRALGDHPVRVRFHPEVTATVQVKVTKEG